MTIEQRPGLMWDEPESEYSAKYPYNNITETESGHIFEMDDTPGAERIRIQHRTGTYTEIRSDGTKVSHIVGSNYQIIAEGNNVLIDGLCHVTINGDSHIHVTGDMYQKIGGDFYQEIDGDYKVTVKGYTDYMHGKNVNFGINGASGKYKITTGLVQMNSDLNVDLSLSAESILSRNEITATTGLHCGLTNSGNPGAATAGITTLGGITVGSPQQLSLPGQITALATYDSVKAPDIHGLFAVRDSSGTMMMIRALYNMHWHPTPKGPSGSPIPKMILM